MERIDLHSHTQYSDGTSTVENSLRCAQEEGLAIFSVTDHNTVDAYSELVRRHDLFSGKLLPGVELSTVFQGEQIEILGYGFSLPEMEKKISEHYLPFREKQIKEAALNVKAVLEKGVVLDPDFVHAMLHCPERIFDPRRQNNRVFLLAEMRRHPENHVFFSSREEFEQIDRHRFTRDYLFNADSTLYSDQSSLSPSVDGVLEIIHSCGGLAFLAHTYVYSKSFLPKLDALCDHGLDGIECHYGTFTAEQKQYLSAYCDAKGLYKSGGSDFHGLDMRPQNLMGLSDGEPILRELVEPWLHLVQGRLI